MNERNRTPVSLSAKSIKLFMLLGAALIIAIMVIIIVISAGKGDRVTTITESSLKEAVKIENLETVEYTFSSVATKYTDKGKPMYHVAYKGTIKAGIKFDEITYKVNESKKEITVEIPKAKITSVDIPFEEEHLETIYEKKKYESETTGLKDVHKVAIEDMKTKTAKADYIFEMAEENSKKAIEAMLVPFFENNDPENEYTVIYITTSEE